MRIGEGPLGHHTVPPAWVSQPTCECNLALGRVTNLNMSNDYLNLTVGHCTITGAKKECELKHQFSMHDMATGYSTGVFRRICREIQEG